MAGLAALAYAWGANSAFLEPFYGAAARSMSQSWHDFFFGAFDPLGTVSIDKLPGALWVQALSLRIFGFHIWAVVLPQILEGVLSVLVLYRAVRRLAGPVAGLASAVVLALTPVTVELNRGNISDSLLILLTVLAADATAAAVLTGRTRRLLLAGLWVGLAFQTKMLQAWLVLPALALAYLLAAPGPLRVRARQIALAGIVAVVVSLAWMSAVSLVPASQRPYVDGTRNDSLFSQVFVYNGYARLGRSEFEATIGKPSAFANTLNREVEKLNVAFVAKPGLGRLLGRPLGRDWGWLLPAACLAAVLLFWERRRFGRRDPRLACVSLWGAWLAILAASFSGGIYINSYYLAALAPALAAICGLGVDLYWRHRREPVAARLLTVALILTGGYGAFLLSGGGRVPAWIVPGCVGLMVLGALAATAGSGPARSRRHAALPWFALASLLAFPAATSALVTSRRQGPFDVPYQAHNKIKPGSVSRYEARVRAYLQYARQTEHTRIAFGAYTSYLASSFIFYSGEEVLPLGGFTGMFPTPTLREFEHFISTNQVRAVLVPVRPVVDDQVVRWIRAKCTLQHLTPPEAGIQLGEFDCAAHNQPLPTSRRRRVQHDRHNQPLFSA